MKKAGLRSRSIKTKFGILLLGAITIMLITSAFAISHIIASENDLLNYTLSRSLALLAYNMERTLDEIAGFSSDIIANSLVQERLAQANHHADTYISDHAKRELYQYLQSLCEKNDALSAISIHTNADVTDNVFFVSGIKRTGASIPVDLLGELTSMAREKNGGVCFTINPNEPGVLYLTRTIRQISKLTFAELGILTIRLDLPQIRNFTNAEAHGAEHILILDADRNVLYNTGLSDDDSVLHIDFNASEYAICSINKIAYFITRSVVHETNRCYYLLQSYSGVSEKIRQAVIFISTLFIIMVVLILALSYSIINAFTSPLMQLCSRMENYTAKTIGRSDLFPVSDLPSDESARLNAEFDYMSSKISSLIEDNYQQAILIQEARYKALEQQLNPHFLYNTLDSVYWRAAVNNQPEIADMVRSLADILRRTLSKENYVTIREELALVASYITIQKYRYEERLDYSEHIGKCYLDTMILKLSIQPLVENALRYGLEQSPDICHVSTSVSSDGEGHILIEVSNDGSSFEDDLLSKIKSGFIKPRGFGVGLSNIDERYRLTYGENYGLKVFNRGNYAIAQLSIPENQEVNNAATHDC